jgi:hypothetical protein
MSLELDDHFIFKAMGFLRLIFNRIFGKKRANVLYQGTMCGRRNDICHMFFK